jgi:DNA-directed RNA polymerase subunit D
VDLKLKEVKEVEEFKMVSIQKISKKQEKETFLIKGINYSTANSIRRSSQEIPILAIDTVEFYKNDSALSDEILAHRLGLVPLKSDKGLLPREKCTCKGKGCIKCKVVLKLKAQGPCTVYSKDLKTKGAEVIYKEMPLTILDKGQQLELSAEAVLGKGKEHAKFSPGLVYYNSYPLIEIKGELPKKCTEICPSKAIIEDKGKITIDPLKCDICGACTEECNEKGKDIIKITPSEQDFIFTIESWGQLPPHELFVEAVKALSNNLNDISKEIKKI